MENYQQILEEIGLNRFEVQIYLHLLNSESLPASKIAAEVKIPRSTTRNILDRLCERNLIEKLYKQNTQYYSCKPPEQLVKFLKKNIQKTKENIQKIEEHLPLLSSIFKNQNIAPTVRVFEGQEQLIEAFRLSLFHENLKEILIFTSYEFLKDPVIKNHDENYFMQNRIKKGIKARVLVGKTKDSQKLATKSPKQLRERRFIPEKYEIPGNIHIYADKVLYFSTANNQYLAVLVEGALMASTLRNLFEFMWDKCK